MKKIIGLVALLVASGVSLADENHGVPEGPGTRAEAKDCGAEIGEREIAIPEKKARSLFGTNSPRGKLAVKFNRATGGFTMSILHQVPVYHSYWLGGMRKSGYGSDPATSVDFNPKEKYINYELQREKVVGRAPQIQYRVYFLGDVEDSREKLNYTLEDVATFLGTPGISETERARGEEVLACIAEKVNAALEKIPVRPRIVYYR